MGPQVRNSLQQCAESGGALVEDERYQRSNRHAAAQRDWIAVKFARFRPKFAAFWALRIAIMTSVGERHNEALGERVAAAHFANHLRRRFQPHTFADEIT